MTKPPPRTITITLRDCGDEFDGTVDCPYEGIDVNERMAMMEAAICALESQIRMIDPARSPLSDE